MTQVETFTNSPRATFKNYKSKLQNFAKKLFASTLERYYLTNGKDPMVEILQDVSASSFFEDLTVGNTK